MSDAQRSHPSANTGTDWATLTAHLALPALIADGVSTLLADGSSVSLSASLFAFLVFGLRPAVWGMAAWFRSAEPARRRAYLARRDAVANPSLIVMAILGLALMDVFKLPGAPHWTNQPNAGLSLAGVAVYLVWLSTHANVPAEVKAGWKGLLGLKGSE